MKAGTLCALTVTLQNSPVSMLKSLEIYGFKSFADRTRFDFSPGVTAIVGPNGSGKSNVVDALKWILGDQSPKSLRGQEMADVIFNGSATRKPAHYAEAFLTFDNRQRFLRLEADEVVIGRRIYRGGDSEYFINKSPARLRDIRDLLVGTGAGQATYAIIEQGRVDQILQANPTSRRVVFDEAAGIGRYKQRRVEAERKLERVEQFLQRLRDLVDELEVKLEATRGQAAKAVKYRELSAELRKWWLGLAADDYRRIEHRVHQIYQEMAQLEAQEREWQAQLNSAEAQETEAIQRLQQSETELRENERLSLASWQKIVERETRLLADLDRLRATYAEWLQYSQSLLNLHAKLEASRVQTKLHDQQTEAALTEFKYLQQTFTEAESAYLAGQDELNNLRNTLQQLDQQSSEVQQVLWRAQQTMHAWETRQESLEQSLRDWEIRWRVAVEDREQARQLLNELQGQRQAECQRLSNVEQTILQQEASTARLRQNLQHLQQEFIGLQEQRITLQARIHVIEDMEARREGMGLGVRELLSRAKYREMAPWNLVLGTVSDLLEVDLQYAAFVEAALGPYAQAIVVRQLQPLLAHLAREGIFLAGRVIFLSLSDLNVSDYSDFHGHIPDTHLQSAWTHARMDQAEGSDNLNGPEICVNDDPRSVPGVISQLSQLVQPSEEVSGLIERLLADVWLIENASVMHRVSPQHRARYRWITLQGELFESWGATHLGPLRSEGTLLTRRSELRQLHRELTQIQHQLSILEQERIQLQSALELQQHALQQLIHDTQPHRERIQQLEAECLRAEHVLSQAQQMCGALEDEKLHLEKELIGVEEKYKQACQQYSLSEQELQVLHQHRHDNQQRQQQLQQELQQQQTLLADIRRQLEQSQQQLWNLERERDKTRQEVQHVEEQLGQGQKRVQHLAEQIMLTKRSLLQARSELADLYAQLDREERHHHQQRLKVDRWRKHRAESAAEASQWRQRLTQVQQNRHQRELQIQACQHELKALRDQMSEEYQLTLEEIVAAGHSAYALWQQLHTNPANQLRAENHPEAAMLLGNDTPTTREPTIAAISLSVASDDLCEQRNLLEHGAIQLGIPDSATRQEIEEHVQRLRRKLKHLGHVNAESLQELEQLEQRYEQLKSQWNDLTTAKKAIEDIIRRMNQESRRLFLDSFSTIRGYFQQLFRKVFGGGEGDLILEDPQNVLDCGIDIVARPPGKELRSLSLLSGGEKTMAAIALVMAIFKAKPSPFCILDEVDAALDEANIDRFTAVLKEFQSTTQFIMITHHKRSMMVADVLHGVTMEEAGVSKRLSIRFEDVSERGEIRHAA